MKDKIRLIYNKIENRIDEICDDGFVLKENQQEYETLTDLEDFIDSFLKEPVNEDLEEEIERCWKEMFPIGWSDSTLLTLTYEQHKAFARHFAEWQKNKMKEALQTEYEKGRFDMRDEMMKDAVECTWGSQATSAFMSDYPNIDIGDKVKIIIIKEEQQ